LRREVEFVSRFSKEVLTEIGGYSDMVAKIPYGDLTPELKRKLVSNDGLIKPKHIALGKVLVDLQLLTHREGVWVLHTALNMVSGRTWQSHKNTLNRSYKARNEND